MSVFWGRAFPEMAAMKGIEQDGYHALDVWSHTMLCLKELESLLENPGRSSAMPAPISGIT